MKKTGLLVLLAANLAFGQATAISKTSATPNENGIVETRVSVPFVRFQTPTQADIYCAGFLSKERIPDAKYVDGGLETPHETKFGIGEIVYLSGTGYQAGQLYSILRQLRDVNEYEVYPGMRRLLGSAGHAYGDIGRVRILDVRSRSAVAQVELSCDPINPGDIAVPFVEKPSVAFHVPGHFDRFAPPNGKLQGRIVLGKDFDTILGSGVKLYLNVGSNQGVKVGDYFRVVRSYTADLENPVDSLSFKTPISEDTQMHTPTFEADFLTRGKGQNIHVRDLPRRAVGEVVVLSTTPTSSSALVVFALEDVYAGDTVELDPQD